MKAKGACTIKHYGSVNYGKWTNFVASFSKLPPLANTLAYNRIRTL
jgi:hypothetical protein